MSDVASSSLVNKVFSVAGGKRVESALPEAALGFEAFRKIELLRIAWAYDLKIDENLPVIDRQGGPCLSAILERHKEDGAFDKPPKYPEKLEPGSGSIAEQGQEAKARKDRIRELEANVVINQRELAVLKGRDRIKPRDTVPKVDPAGQPHLDWDALRARAKELGVTGINAKKRPLLEAAVREAEACGDVPSCG